MGTFKGKRPLLYVLLIASIVAFSSFIPPLRPPIIALLRFPLIVLTAVKNEIGGMIFYHRNMVLAGRLTDENRLLQRKVSDAQEAYRENARLTELLNLKKSVPYKVIAARVIGKSPSNWSSSLIIDRGSASGIRKGYVCVNFLGLIGRVVEVSPSSSKILMINDPNLCVSSLLQRSREEGLISGSLSGTLIMKYLSRESDIRVSDAVVTSGLTEAFPKGIVIGTVAAIREEFSGSRYAVVRPAVDLSTVEEVLVIIP
ncbi:MAG: rod shape-determining protein MreC [Deltaproteobacteria bacterium]